MIDEHSRPLAAQFHFRHCDGDDMNDGEHVCQGVITITATRCVFECRKCGTDTMSIGPEVQAARERAAISHREHERMVKEINERIAKEMAFFP